MAAQLDQILAIVTRELILHCRFQTGQSREALDHGHKDVLLAAKVTKERHLVDAGSVGQGAGCGPGVALLGKDLGRGLQDALPGVVDILSHGLPPF